MVRTIVYIAIILILAAGVAVLPNGGAAANTVSVVLSVAFLGTMAWFAGRLYRENRVALYALGDRWRTILYVAVGVAVVTLAATTRLWETSAGVLVWFALLFGVAYALYVTWRHAREF